jgi:hypothetical protein
MTKVHTHYDNLKVTRNAPPEVIRAAYRTLSQKYHPDMNPGKPDAERVMKALNAAYEVLSDPAKRQQHDAWIAIQEASPSNAPPDTDPCPSQSKAPEKRRGEGFTVNEANLKDPSRSTPSFAFRVGVFVSHVLRNIVWYLIGAGVLIAALSENKKTASSPPYAASPTLSAPSANPFDRFDEKTATPVEVPAAVRPFAAAPNGSARPLMADYVDGYPQFATGGLSTVLWTTAGTTLLFSRNSCPSTPPRRSPCGSSTFRPMTPLPCSRSVRGDTMFGIEICQAVVFRDPNRLPWRRHAQKVEFTTGMSL